MRLVIIGAGGYGRVIADVSNQMNCFDMICFLDDKNEAALGKCADFITFADSETLFYPAFGNNELRLQWIQRLESSNCRIAKIVHPSAYISPDAGLQYGVAVLPGATINTNTTIAKGCIINCGAIIDHDCIIEESVHICLGAIIKAENRIPACTKVEAGEIIQNRTFPL